MSAQLVALARGVGFALAFASYWTPWVAHKAAGLAIAEVDLVEFPKFMPQVRQQELFVWRESFYVALLALSLALVMWAARARALPTWLRWLMRLAALGIPLTPSVFNIFEGREFQTQLTMMALVAALIMLTPLLRRAPSLLVMLIMLGIFTLGALAPTIQFLQLKSALDDIYHQPVAIGWGLWAGLIGFGLLGAAEVVQHAARESKI